MEKLFSFKLFLKFAKGTGNAVCSAGVNWEEEGGEDDSVEVIGEEYISRQLSDPNQPIESTRIGASPRQLNPNGYVLKVVVYYDELFREQFGEDSVTRVDALMALVDEMYAEESFQVGVSKDKLKDLAYHSFFAIARSGP